MKHILATFLFLFFITGLQAQNQSNKKAVIQFTGEKNRNTRTYLGKLKKGDPYRLKDYLQSGTDKQTDEQKDENFAPKEYKAKKDRNKIHYLPEDSRLNEKKLKKGKSSYTKKYREEKEKAFSEKMDSEHLQAGKDKEIELYKKPRKAKTRLAKNFKIKGKRLRKGKKLRYTAGNVSLLLKYEVRSNNTVKTYVTDLNVKLEAGKKYLLKYYGNETKRKYYLEVAPGR
ncbi:MAG: hypothetical protein ACERKD_20885 [Prolixibacteraceae bacterium]